MLQELLLAEEVLLTYASETSNTHQVLREHDRVPLCIKLSLVRLLIENARHEKKRAKEAK